MTSGEYTRTFRVRWSATNALGHVGLAGYLRYLMETAWEWGEAGGLGLKRSNDLGIAWIIRETTLEIFRPLSAGDQFDFSIWLVEWRHVRGSRCFEIKRSSSDDVFARGVQSLVTLDIHTLRPLKLPPELMQNFMTPNPRKFEQPKLPKIGLSPDLAFETRRAIEWRDLDSLEHVNNATYASFVEESAVRALSTLEWPPSRLKSQGLAVENRRFHIRYRSPAVWGEALNVTACLFNLTPNGGSWYIEISRVVDNSLVVQSTLDWFLTDRATGGERQLPGELYQALEKRVIS
jgi:YbgC/YbaW family acyl-CoA thioester hydrolase